MDRLEALVGLNLMLDIGSIRLNKLLKFFGTPENILKTSREKLMQVAGVGEVIAGNIVSLKEKDIEKEFKLANKLGVKIVTQDSHDYPKNLKYIIDPPIVLYIKGELKEEDNLAIAIVGSRRASFYGLSNAEKFAAELSLHGITIISGMARGVDTYAHQGALKAGGRTIAVIGSGLNRIYPPENKKLAEEVARNGAVISEFPFETEPLKHNFPRRNRVISGLSLGTLVVEAAVNSGALITSDFALEQGREVFALPGKVDSNNSSGTNRLIQQGAKLVTSVDDILEEFTFLSADTVAKSPLSQQTARNRTAAPVEQDNYLFNLISKEPISLDEIAEKTNVSISVLSDQLLKLQLKHLIKQLPGKQFIRS